MKKQLQNEKECIILYHTQKNNVKIIKKMKIYKKGNRKGMQVKEEFHYRIYNPTTLMSLISV